MIQLNDIENRGDLESLINAFYDRVKADEVIGHIFHKIIGEDWSHHLPIMYQFWETVMFAKPGYSGNPVRKHVEVDQRVELKKEHYEKWLELWRATVDDMFAGPRAEEIKQRAVMMMQMISMKVDWARQGKSIL